MKKFFLFLVFLLTAGLRAELFFTPSMIDKHLSDYSKKEIEWIQKDLEVVHSVCLDGAKKSNPRFYLATAGAPGARKTTILERFLSTHSEYQPGVYLDPDARTLRYMVHTYYAQSLNSLAIAQAMNYGEVIQKAYDKWRGASNYILLSLLEEAFASGYSIIHGTTATGQHVPDFLARLKQNDYQIILLLCSCPDSVRKESIEYRNNTVRFYQSSPEDALSKGKFFPDRMGAYFAYADLLYFYWSDRLNAPERLAAIWKKGTLEIIDQQAMDQFIDKYETDRMALLAEGHILPPFETYLK